MDDQTKRYRVDMTCEHHGKDGGISYAIYRVVLSGTPDHLICAFYGPASYFAAHAFCDNINNDPDWNKD